MRILIVEDDIVSQTILTKALDSRGHAVTIANDGAEAVGSSKRTILTS